MTEESGKPRARFLPKLLLAASLGGGILASMYAGSALADAAADLLGIASPGGRLAAKVVALLLAVPAGFYAVERIFLRATRGGRQAR